MIKYYDAEASSDSAELEDMNNAYVYAYKNNYRADSHHSEIIGDRYTENKPKVKKVNRTRNSEYRTNIARNSKYNRNSVYNSNVTLDVKLEKVRWKERKTLLEYLMLLFAF